MVELHDIHLTFNPGTVNGKARAFAGLISRSRTANFDTVIGGNGAGKSTMLNTIAGTYRSGFGKDTHRREGVTRLPEYKRAVYIGRVFSGPHARYCADHADR